MVILKGTDDTKIVNGPPEGSTKKVGVTVGVEVGVAVGPAPGHVYGEHCFIQVLLRQNWQHGLRGAAAGRPEVGVGDEVKVAVAPTAPGVGVAVGRFARQARTSCVHRLPAHLRISPQ